MKNTKADVILKAFWRANERFADLFNAVVFDGKQVLDPEALQELDSDVFGMIEMKGQKETLSRTRDVVKKAACGAEYVIQGVEQQQYVHYAMPLRNMIYAAQRSAIQGGTFSAAMTSGRHLRPQEIHTQESYIKKLNKGDRL